MMFEKPKTDIKKEEMIDIFRTTPSRRLSDIEKQMIFILMEKSKIKRERSMMILNKGFMIFFAFVIIAVLVRINDVIPQLYINLLFLFGIVVLIFGIALYSNVINEEEKNLDKILDSFLK